MGERAESRKTSFELCMQGPSRPNAVSSPQNAAPQRHAPPPPAPAAAERRALAGKDFLPSYLEHNSHLLTNRRRCRLRSTPRLTSDVEQGHGLEGPVGAGRIHHHPAARFITCQHLGSAGKAMGSLRRETSLHFSFKKKDKLGLCSWRELAGS